MTETLHEPPPPPEPQTAAPEPPGGAIPAPRRLVRDPDDKVVAGVCAGLGRYTDTDPVLWRVTVGVLTVFGGAGLVLYVLAWALVPRTGSPASFAERTLRGPDRTAAVIGAGLLGLVAIAVLDLIDTGLVVLAVVVGVVLLASRERRAGIVPGPSSRAWGPAAPPSAYGVPPSAYGVPPSAYGVPPSAYGVPPVVPAWEPAPPALPRERSVLGPVTLSVATLVAGVMLLLREIGVDGITGPRVLAAALLVVGAGLVVATWIGRARWLFAVGVVLALLLVPAAALDGRLAGGAGERTWVPVAADDGASYELGAGEATLDLRRVEPGSVGALTARVGLGRLLVLVPDDLRVRVVPEIGLGELVRDDGNGRTVSSAEPFDDRGVDEVLLGRADGRELVLGAEVGLGELEVRRVAS